MLTQMYDHSSELVFDNSSEYEIKQKEESKIMLLYSSIHSFKEVMTPKEVCKDVLDGLHGMSANEWFKLYNSLK